MENKYPNTNLNGDPIAEEPINKDSESNQKEAKLMPKTEAIEQNLAATAEALKCDGGEKAENVGNDTYAGKEKLAGGKTAEKPENSQKTEEHGGKFAADRQMPTDQALHVKDNEGSNTAKEASKTEHAHKYCAHKNMFSWCSLCIVLLTLIVGYCGGYFGGRNAAKAEILDYQKEMLNDSSYGNVPWGYIFDNSPSYPDYGDGSDNIHDVLPSENKAVLGIAVQATDSGLKVIKIGDDSKAADAGLRIGDIITKVDGNDAKEIRKFSNYIATKSAGDKVTLTVERDGKTVNINDVELIANEAEKGKKS